MAQAIKPADITMSSLCETQQQLLAMPPNPAATPCLSQISTAWPPVSTLNLTSPPHWLKDWLPRHHRQPAYLVSKDLPRPLAAIATAQPCACVFKETSSPSAAPATAQATKVGSKCPADHEYPKGSTQPTSSHNACLEYELAAGAQPFVCLSKSLPSSQAPT